MVLLGTTRETLMSTSPLENCTPLAHTPYARFPQLYHLYSSLIVPAISSRSQYPLKVSIPSTPLDSKASGSRSGSSSSGSTAQSYAPSRPTLPHPSSVPASPSVLPDPQTATDDARYSGPRSAQTMLRLPPSLPVVPSALFASESPIRGGCPGGECMTGVRKGRRVGGEVWWARRKILA